MTAAFNIEEPTAPSIDVRALPAGTKLLGGQYVITSYLSSGGFGITYLAQDSLQRTVVIKECFPEALCARQNKTVMARSTSCTNEFNELVKMFLREARSLSRLNHPNIVRVHQVFEDNETAYMALDHVDGKDLLSLIEDPEHRVAPVQIVELTRCLLAAVASVHDTDMLHRDISPDNILLNQDGQPVLIDFGAAREEAKRKSRAISALLVVKDGYSPQEFYISGGVQGPSSDLYSLAATVYHLITGILPPNSQVRLAALASRKPDPYVPLLNQTIGFPPAFLTAIDRAMSVFPNDRPQSAAEWLAIIDGRANGHLTSESELKAVIANLVADVAKTIDEEVKTPPSREAAPEPVTLKLVEAPERDRWWPLTEPLEEESVEPVPEAAAPPAPEPVEKARPKRSAKRRLSALVLVAAVWLTLIPSSAEMTNDFVQSLRHFLETTLASAKLA